MCIRDRCYSLALLEVHVFTDSEFLGLARSQLYLVPVSYTHLDVYRRQPQNSLAHAMHH